MEPKNTNRYTVPANEDTEPGANGQVLKNHLGIKSKNKIEEIEKQELERVEKELVAIFTEDHQFTADDICNIHGLWLGNIYPSAGVYRSVQMEKEGFLFAAPNFIPRLMQEFENKFLKQYTPCKFKETTKLAHALGVTHVELIIIHPFREGNGRIARLLADLMVMQARRPPLNFSAIDQTTNYKGFENYIRAIHAGVVGNYEPIEDIFLNLLTEGAT